jgi:ABC-type phosphate transport system substrate-binding protein
MNRARVFMGSQALMRRRLLALTLAALVTPRGRSAAPEGAVAVIAAAGSSLPALRTDELAQLYRRRKLFVGAQRVQPVNLPAQHPLRRWFSQQLLGASPQEMEGYWRDLYFDGVTPPFVLASEEAVIRFVAATPGAIGYVCASWVDRRVRVLLQLEGGPGCNRPAP